MQEDEQSSDRHEPGSSERSINLGALIVGGVIFLPFMALSSIGLFEGLADGEGHFIISTLLQILGLGFLWWRIAITTRWPLIFLYILIAACFYLLMIGLCATGI